MINRDVEKMGFQRTGFRLASVLAAFYMALPAAAIGQLSVAEPVRTVASTPDISDPFQDTDLDGLTDLDEINLYGTDYDVADSDSDGLLDGEEVNLRFTNPLLWDTDGDTLGDGEEIQLTFSDPTLADTDGDGIDDNVEAYELGTLPFQADSDDGGVDDGAELLAGTDPLNGKDDIVDLDLDNDGIPNDIEGRGDQDGDGIPNDLDLDSDNDGIPDIIEAGGVDLNGDGMVDNLVDLNNDGLDDNIASAPLPRPDSDGDGLADYLDLDSDQDGLPDVFENGGSDIDRDGVIDNFVDANSDGWDDLAAQSGASVLDQDGDGIPNYLDLDSDGDGQTDLSESGGLDFDNDGVIDLFLDDDNDGIPNQADVDVTGGTDSDGDGIDDGADVSFTAGDDANGNGIDDNFEGDVNGDGLVDAVANTPEVQLPDTDADGTPDVLDGNPSLVRIGLDGTGCSIGSGSGAVDPLLPIVLLLSLLACLRRRAV